MAPTIYSVTAPWPTLAFLEGCAALARPEAQPWQARGLARRQKAHPNPPATCHRVFNQVHPRGSTVCSAIESGEWAAEQLLELY